MSVTEIDQIICQSINPFDLASLRPGNFWQEQQDKALTVDSIHSHAITDIEELLDRVAQDRRSRTVLLLGDAGSGKSYLLGRMKRTFNPKAFFAYIGPWPNSDGIWRHILRYTVDSLVRVPEGQTESQLMLWLKSLSVFRKLTVKEVLFEESVWNLLRSNRQKFVKQFKETYRHKGIYNAESFFGVLHDLTDPELSDPAIDWLRGDDLSDESLKLLKVKHSIQTEEAACEILSNLGRIATETQPIVLCFDQLDSIPHLPDGSLDIQPLFNVNTNIHNQKLESFLIIISVTTNTWQRNSKHIQHSDLDRIDKQVRLKLINIEQIEALWAMRLHSLHQQAKPKPKPSIYPLNREQIKIRFPSGKTLPRSAISVGRELYQQYKEGLIKSTENGDPDPNKKTEHEKLLAEFKLDWKKEYAKTQEKLLKIALLSSPELIRMLSEALQVLEIPEIKTKLLRGKYSNYSLSFLHPQKKHKVGAIWTEDRNMTSFFHVMKASQRVLDRGQAKTLYLIRAMDVGTPNLAGNKLYRKIFTGYPHCHIKENLTSVHYLATYHSLLNSAKASELVIAGKTISIQELGELIRETEILNKCKLLQDLGVVSPLNKPNEVKPIEPILEDAREFLLNRIQTQGFMGLKTLIDNGMEQFGAIDRKQIEKQIQQLNQEGRLRISDPKEPLEKQLVFWVPSNSSKLN